MWSNSNLASYLTLAAHWIAVEESSGRLSIKSALIGFHHVKKKHSGVNVAKNILYLLDRANAMLKVCCLQELQSLLAEREVTFNPKN